MSEPDGRALDRAISRLLRFGVLASALVLLVGGGVYLVRHGTEPLAGQTPDLLAPFRPLAAKYSRPAEIARAIGRGEARPMVQVGVLVLIATPILRVLFTVGAFARRRDRVYVAIPLVVLLALLVGLAMGQFD